MVAEHRHGRLAFAISHWSRGYLVRHLGLYQQHLGFDGDLPEEVMQTSPRNTVNVSSDFSLPGRYVL